MSSEMPAIAEEITRAEGRRARLNIPRPVAHANKQWALCLSGGGIRSATFCLGVLQGVAKSSPPPAAIPPSAPSPLANSASAAAPTTLLPQFDYVSTVSGGGYVGAFFSSLFVKGRVSGNDQETEETAAVRAYDALTEEPPERMHSRTLYDHQRPGHAALAWLRDNGRYLAPTGSGDMVYAAAIGIRNWFATHYVLATLTLLVLSVLLGLRIFASTLDGYGAIEQVLRDPKAVWWSSSWVAVAVVIVLGVIPAGVGFWFTHPSKGSSVSGPAAVITQASIVASLAGVVACALGVWGFRNYSGAIWSQASFIIGACALAGVACLALTRVFLRPQSISEHRVVMSRLLASSFMLIATLAALASVETIAQTIALRVSDPAGSLISWSTFAAAFVWLTRFVAQRMSEKSSSSIFKKIPWHVLAGVVALLLWLLVAVLLDMLLLWIVSNGEPQTLFVSGAGATAQSQLTVAVFVCLFLLLFALSTGRFPGFLNLSTFQGLYSARLTRAYLGASNFKRFEKFDPKLHSVAEPAPGDNLTVRSLYASKSAPLHYINVCVNQNVDPGAQLVQRDRKGKPFVLAPQGFYLDGRPFPFPDGGNSELDSTLTVGEWVGVSGAAFTTGLGRSTSLGGSLLLGFANVRLGRWWFSGAQSKQQSQLNWRRRAFGTQLYLLDEIRALFHGTRLPYQYLSDGGHFENTAAYEMVRPGRDIALLVVCDCGADPNYEFDDLANLIRLARIDHGVEITVNASAASNPLLGRRFGMPEHFKRTADGSLPPPSERCAILLDVHAPTMSSGTAHRSDERKLVARIVLIKPTILSGVSADVQNYAARHATFPQEPTADQFFNEAQWESYRKLGLQVALNVFPQEDSDPSYRDAFWKAVLV